MARKPHMDAFGASSLIGFAVVLAFGQVVAKVSNEGMNPVFFAGVRSAGAMLCIAAWMLWRRIPIRVDPGTGWAGLLIGLCFSVEFLGLFTALDLTTVSRASLMFYSMPVWLTVIAHFILPGERISPLKAVGLGLAFSGVGWAILDRPANGAEASLLGDICGIIGAFGWAGITLCARMTAMSRVRPEVQLMWQVAISAPVLLLAAPLFGPLIRDLQPIHLWGLAFHTVILVSAGFILWLWLLSIYPASSVASFSFLSPVFSVIFGWALLGEALNLTIIGALVLVSGGVLLINLRPRAA
ncbi:DMT family transporter [Actibacterium sp.]|uniref:DMT family transporter n=1 Tax=Actibacterium sp. TaxID=1872125 RepID=UPI003569E9EB